MAYISFQPKDYYFTKTYTGNSSTQTFTDIGFQPAMVWIKDRDDTYNHQVHLAVRDEPYYFLRTNNNTTGDSGSTNTVTAFTSTGFNIGDNGGCNNSGDDIVAWCWKGGTTSGLSGGTITPSAYNINTTSGFGTYKYAGNGTDGATIAHGLGAAPEMIILKCITDTADWYMGHHRLNNGTTPWNYALFLNGSGADGADTGFNNTAPSSTLVTLGNVSTTNNSGKSYIMYAFVGKKGHSKFGSYKGNANADGTFIYTGFRPAWFMAMNTDASGSDKYIFDDKRAGYNVQNNRLAANNNYAESTDVRLDFVSNGVKIRNTGNPNNTDEWAYAAFAEFPIVSSNDIPGVAR